MDTLSQLRWDLQEGAFPRRVWTGAWCAAQGILLTLRSPALLRLALIPVLINLGLYPLAGYGAWQLVAPVHGLLFPWNTPGGLLALPVQILSLAVWLLTVAVLGLCALLCVNAVGSALASPFLDLVGERTQAMLTRETVPVGPSALGAVVLAVRMQALLLVLFLAGTLGCGLVSLIPGVGFVLGLCSQAGVTVFFLCLQMLDWAAQRHGFTLKDRVQLILAHKGAALGFGAACWAMLLFPFTLPFGAAGGTLFFLGLLPTSQCAAQPPA